MLHEQHCLIVLEFFILGFTQVIDRYVEVLRWHLSIYIRCLYLQKFNLKVNFPQNMFVINKL